MFAAASINDTSVRDQLIGGIHGYVSNGPAGSNLPFTVMYSPASAAEMVSPGGLTDGGGINRYVAINLDAYIGQ